MRRADAVRAREPAAGWRRFELLEAIVNPDHRRLGLAVLLALLVPCAAQAAPRTGADWTRFESPALGVSLERPTTWRVEAPGHAVRFMAPEDGPLAGQRIELVHFENTPRAGQSLADWVRLKVELDSELPGDKTGLSIDRVEQIGGDDERPTEIVHTRVSRSGFAQHAVWLRHGQIVWALLSYSLDPSLPAVLQRMVGTLRFAPTAAGDLNTLYGVEREWPTLESQLAWLRSLPVRDARLASAPPPEPPDPEAIQASVEREMAAERERDPYAFDELPDVEARLFGDGAPPAEAPTATRVYDLPGTRKTLPMGWYSPIRINNRAVFCGSAAHTTQGDQFAADVQVGAGTPLYSSESGTVGYSDFNTQGYGELIRIDYTIWIADEWRTYKTYYAHMTTRAVTSGSVSRGTYLGTSGNTGNSGGAHLHYAVRDSNNNPVDLAPLMGFRANTLYPNYSATCGYIHSPFPAAQDAQVLDAVSFYYRNQRSNSYWYCYLDQHLGECTMKSVPDSGLNFGLATATAPQLRYYSHLPSGTYYLWVCGKGNNSSNDSINMGTNNALASTAQEMTGWDGTSWVWKSIRMNGARPYMYINVSQTIDLWTREDGMQFTRAFLSRFDYMSPATFDIRCGGGPNW